MFARLVPAPLVRFFARPYVAGDSVADALDTAAHALGRGLTTTLDVLGEDVRTAAQVLANVDLYTGLVDALVGDARFAADGARPTISLKPSAFTAGGRAEAFDAIEKVVVRARDNGVGVTIDMEDRRWTDVTLDRAIALFEAGHDVGTVLQTRLNRTEEDLERIPAGMRLRLVIGIYPEPPDVAITSKPEMKERMLAYAERLLARGVFVEFATHDTETVERFARDIAPRAPDRVEVQMLLGVPRRTLQRSLREQGLAVRLYVPFAISWADATAYLRRRMAESPSTAWLVLRNLFAARDR